MLWLLAVPVAVVIALGAHKTTKQTVAALPFGKAMAFPSKGECDRAAEGLFKDTGGKVKADCTPIMVISKKQETF